MVCLLAFVTVSALSWVYQQERGASCTAGSGRNEKPAPVYRVRTDEKKVGLSFEAAWDCQGLEEILAVLTEKEAGATFFVTGEWMEKYPEQLLNLQEAGMELANGGPGLRDMTGISVGECQNGIQETEKQLSEMKEKHSLLLQEMMQVENERDQANAKQQKAETELMQKEREIETLKAQRMEGGRSYQPAQNFSASQPILGGSQSYPMMYGSTTQYSCSTPILP